METVTFKTTPTFQAGINALVHKAGLNAKTVVAKETGEAIKTLSRITPKGNAKKIEANIRSKFDAVGQTQSVLSRQQLMQTGSKHGRGDVFWYSVNSRFLKGVAKAADMRKATVEELSALRWKITKRGRLSQNFRHPRRVQKVLITQRILTRAATVAKVVKKSVGHIGRLAAGWLPAATQGPIQLTGSNMPPGYVMRHAVGARGTFMNTLSNLKFPRFTLVNFAKGAGRRDMGFWMKKAMNIRGKAMQANALLFMKGKKKLGDYAR